MAKRKRMRLPNGFGQISEIKNARLRKPFRAMVTVGKDENGKPICKPLKPEAYFKTYNDAYQALMKYHESPYELNDKLTLGEVYQRWFDRHYADDKNKSYSNKMATLRAWAYCKDVENIPMRDIRVKHIKHCMENGVATVRGKEQTPNALTQRTIKTVFNQIFDYAIEYDIVSVNYARNFKASSDAMPKYEPQKEHIPYTDDEMNIIWKQKGDPIADLILVQCYSGWRPQEIVKIQRADVNINDWTFSGGMKTDSGKNRIVPIHTAIRDIVERWYHLSEEAGVSSLFFESEKKGPHEISYQHLSEKYKELKEILRINPEHRPHDGRKHFVTQAKKYKVDEYAIKYMVGHAISDITEKVYTKRDIKWLSEEIEKIK